jgi:hypothetical protein
MSLKREERRSSPGQYTSLKRALVGPERALKERRGEARLGSIRALKEP